MAVCRSRLDWLQRVMLFEKRDCGIAVQVQLFFFFQAEDGIRDLTVTGVQTCALPISPSDKRKLRATVERAFPAEALPEALVVGEAPDEESCKLAHVLGGRRWTEVPRSEERRVGKECRSRWSPDH